MPAAMHSGPLEDEAICITADEINCLIYSYLKDSGFVHSAFAIKAEGQLDRSPYVSRHIPRGELIDLLSKALLYIETERHFHNNTLRNNCKAPFTLLEPHVCTPEQVEEKMLLVPASTPPVEKPKTNGLAHEPSSKRKGSPSVLSNEGPAGKRQRSEPKDIESDKPTDVQAVAGSSTSAPEPEDAPENAVEESRRTRKSTRKIGQVQGPGDPYTDPRCAMVLQGHQTEVFVCAFNPTRGNLVATGSKDATVRLWDLPDSPSGETEFASAPSDGGILVDWISNKSSSDLTCLSWNPDGTLLAIGSFDSILRIATPDGKPYFTHTQHRGPLFATKFSKSGRWLLTGSLDGTTCLWHVEEKRLHKQYQCHSDCCLDVDWLDENMFATCGADHMIHVMHVEDGSLVKTFEGHTDEVNMIKRSPSGTHLASCSDDTTARIWDIQGICGPDAIPGLTGSTSVVVLEGHTLPVSSLQWCPVPNEDSHYLLATSSFDNTSRLWDSVTGECLQTFSDHTKPVYALAFSPDGRWVATGGGDGWLYVYSVATREKKWSWFSDPVRQGVFEIDWYIQGDLNRMVLALECRDVVVIDITKIADLNYGKP